MYNSLFQAVRCLLLTLLMFSVGRHWYDPFSRVPPANLRTTQWPESRVTITKTLMELFVWNRIRPWSLKTAQIELRKGFRRHFHIHRFHFRFQAALRFRQTDGWLTALVRQMAPGTTWPETQDGSYGHTVRTSRMRPLARAAHCTVCRLSQAFIWNVVAGGVTGVTSPSGVQGQSPGGPPEAIGTM